MHFVNYRLVFASFVFQNGVMLTFYTYIHGYEDVSVSWRGSLQSARTSAVLTLFPNCASGDTVRDCMDLLVAFARMRRFVLTAEQRLGLCYRESIEFYNSDTIMVESETP
jgi:hypothetical protein